VVRMGELQASAEAGDVLVSVGLGSCIGLALVDPARGVGGLAHILLPESSEGTGCNAAKFADTAVPALAELVGALGGVRSKLRAVLVGGAQMFSFAGRAGSPLDIGARNEQSTRSALERLGVRVGAAATAGSTGRTIRVYVGEGKVTVKEAGAVERPLYAGVGR
jgi:chemotaxis protein CheD